MRHHHTTAAPVRQTEISPSERAKLAATLALAESASNPRDGERLAAIGAVERLLAKRGLALRDLPSLAPEPHREPLQSRWRATCAALAQRPGPGGA